MENVVAQDFWRDKRVFITGHTGFKGSWLAFMLSGLGAEVTGYALPPSTDPNLFDLLDLKNRVVSRFGDVRDLDAMQGAIAAADPQIVLHLAAQALVRQGYAAPVETFETNVIGTVNTLEAARGATALRALVVVTSDKCYANDDRSSGYREDDPLGGDDPYSSSKACAELVTAAYRKSFFEPSLCNLATARAGNVIGGGDWSRDRLVPDIIGALVNNAPLLLRNPSATRPWQHVLEPLAGYLTLAERLYSDKQYAQAWNFGPSDAGSITVSEIVRSVREAWNGTLVCDVDTAPQPAESKHLTLTASKAREQLGWAPVLSNRQTIDWTVEWYKAFDSGHSPKAVTTKQVERYLSYRQ